MKRLRINYRVLKLIIVNTIFFTLFSASIFSKDISFEIQGNDFTDTNVIISLLKNIPDNFDNEYSNDIIKALYESNLFSNVSVKFEENKYIIIVTEFPNINKIYFDNNERLDDDELRIIASELKLKNYNDLSINNFINDLKKVYQSFGYNNVIIEYSEKIFNDTNTVDLFFDIDEGKITKINKIIIVGNDSIPSKDILENIKSKTKSIRNIFANNNFKPITVDRDEILIANIYKNNGYLDIDIKTKIEYLKSNKVNIYFNIVEGSVYNLSSIQINDKNNILKSNTFELINNETDKFLENEKIFSAEKIREFRKQISTLIINTETEFLEIKTFDKVNNNDVEIIFEILPITPKYAKQINIIGNSRTFDYVIRREIEIAEGDAVYKTQIQNIKDRLTSLNLFESVSVKEEIVDENSINLIIEVKEKQTGTFNAGVSVGTLDGFAIVTGLRERNFYGTGRSLDILVNTSEDKNQFKLITTDRLSYENDADISYKINYKQQDLSKASSYKLDTFSSGIGIGYKLNKNILHNVDLEYVLKDYRITNSSTVSDTILKSSGGSISYLIKNNFRYSTLNSGFLAKNGNYINFNNVIETPNSSTNGFIRNIITLKKYYTLNNNIFSTQTKLGNIFSLNNNEILTDDKFALGGRWLRGFDNYGVGPRNSRTAYIGGNNIIVTKLDYSHEVTKNSNFPIYFNLFNDYGLLWENKTKPTQSDNSLRSSAGFGIKYYSPIGPIGVSWGFPLMDEEYDIKRMFLFSIGNID